MMLVYLRTQVAQGRRVDRGVAERGQGRRDLTLRMTVVEARVTFQRLQNGDVVGRGDGLGAPHAGLQAPVKQRHSHLGCRNGTVQFKQGVLDHGVSAYERTLQTLR